LILYELLAGLHPFDATDPVRLFLQQRTVPPPPIATRSPGVTVPAKLESVVGKLLEKDPKDRYASAAEVVTALDAAMSSTGIEAVPELPTMVRLPAVPLPSFELPETAASETAPSEAAPRAAPSTDAVTAVLARAAKLPGVVKIAEMLPADGRFPRWAYVAFPALAVVFVAALLLLSSRSTPDAPGEATDMTAPGRVEGAPSASAAPREAAMEVSGLDASGWRMNLRNAARKKEWGAASEAVLTLLRLDPGAFHDHDVQAALRNTATGLEDAGGEPADKFFDALQTSVQGLEPRVRRGSQPHGVQGRQAGD
jgi:hypothetical protein